MSVIKIKR